MVGFFKEHRLRPKTECYGLKDGKVTKLPDGALRFEQSLKGALDHGELLNVNEKILLKVIQEKSDDRRLFLIGPSEHVKKSKDHEDVKQWLIVLHDYTEDETRCFELKSYERNGLEQGYQISPKEKSYDDFPDDLRRAYETLIADLGHAQEYKPGL